MGLNDTIKNVVEWDAPSVDSEDSLRDAIYKMASCKSSLLVKLNGVVAGIVSDMDVMHSLVEGDDLDETKVSGFMTACQVIAGQPVKSPCIQLHEDETVKNALGVMDTAGVHNLVVSGDHDKRVGTVSICDLLKLIDG